MTVKLYEQWSWVAVIKASCMPNIKTESNFAINQYFNQIQISLWMTEAIKQHLATALLWYQCDTNEFMELQTRKIKFNESTDDIFGRTIKIEKENQNLVVGCPSYDQITLLKLLQKRMNNLGHELLVQYKGRLAG